MIFQLIVLAVAFLPWALQTEDLPWKDCRESLLMDRYDRLSLFNASSNRAEYPYQAHFWPYPYLQQPRSELASGWCPDQKQMADPILKNLQYLEVDLGVVSNITGIATQGERKDKKYWTYTYNLNFSDDGKKWWASTNPKDDKVISYIGNNNTETVATQWLKKVVRARHVRVIPTKWEKSCCLRFEVFGCNGGITKPLGLTHAQVSRLDMEVSSKDTWGVDFINRDIHNRSKGWRVAFSRRRGDLIDYFQLRLRGIHNISGYSVEGCSSRPCTPSWGLLSYANDTSGLVDFNVTKENYKKVMEQLLKIKPTEAFMNKDHDKVTLVMFEPVVATVLRLFLFRRHVRLDGCASQEYGFCARVEFYGKDLECKSPIGVERGHTHSNAAVKNEQMTASSANPGNEAHLGRIHLTEKIWCPLNALLDNRETQQTQYLQIDFIKLKKIKGVSTQGFETNYVRTYYMYYAVDESMFHCYSDSKNGFKKVFTGNTEGYKEVVNWLLPPVKARFVRFNPQTWNRLPCLKVEVYGCDADCSSPLGMEQGMIETSQISASSESNTNQASWGRLNSVGWCVSDQALMSPGADKQQQHYLQIDLKVATLIQGVAVQGKEVSRLQDRPEAVTAFYLKYSYLGDLWLRYHKLLTGEFLGNSVVRHLLDPPVVGKFIRFNPQTWRSPKHICMRVEAYGCYNQEIIPSYRSLGMESFGIPDQQLTASSQADSLHLPAHARFNHRIRGGAWKPKISDRTQYLQIDAGRVVVLTGVASQGHPGGSYRVTAFEIRLATQVNEVFQPYTVHENKKEFVANVDQGTTVFQSINPSRCRYVQIFPVSWVNGIALRVELYGYNAGCSGRLGLVSGEIGPTHLSASSSEDHISGPPFGRLHSSNGQGAWCAGTHDEKQYLQIQLSDILVVSGVATQGQKHADNWVTKYTLMYSGNGGAWTEYVDPKSGRKLWTGNEDRDSSVLHFFSVPFVARYVRFQPKNWNNKICMRVELYGCSLESFPCAADNKCSPAGHCIRVDGADICMCKGGYSGDGKTCEDLDECAPPKSPCVQHADCVNTVGSYDCRCKQGFSKVGIRCKDNNECVMDAHVCPLSIPCVNTIGSFKCSCEEGFEYNSVKLECTDIDECTNSQSVCHPLAKCINTDGSYTCNCTTGYKGNGRVACQDVDECQDNPDACAKDRNCENTEGSYKCVCNEGYILREKECADLDECTKGTTDCPPHSECVNTVGSYTCKCKTGFYSNGPHCLDVNECVDNTHNCDVNAWCTNTAGSFKCFCKTGYKGDGNTCQKQEERQCEVGDENCEE